MRQRHSDVRPDAWLTPDWPAPPGVRAISTLRSGGVSQPPYQSFNLAQHVGDDPQAVSANRDYLRQQAQLPAMPRWLTQVHGAREVNAARVHEGYEADAAFTHQPGVVCAVMTADCLPVLFCEDNGQWVAAVHAGWRGLAAGIIESAVRRMATRGEHVMAWLGPAIGPHAFEVGDEVRGTFVDNDAAAAGDFIPSPSGRWLMDIYALARRRLAGVGVRQIYGGHWCTASEADRFFSYRRDGRTGRMASLIWIQQ